MAQGFGMKIIGFDAYPNQDLSHTLNFFLCIPPRASRAVRHHFSPRALQPTHSPPHQQRKYQHDKKGSYLINTARGAVVETDALVEALKSGALAGAALDVLEEEGELNNEETLLTAPHPNEGVLRIALENHYLINHPRVIVTPHLAFNTQEAVERILNTTIENIQHFAAGAPTNLVSQ